MPAAFGPQQMSHGQYAVTRILTRRARDGPDHAEARIAVPLVFSALVKRRSNSGPAGLSDVPPSTIDAVAVRVSGAVGTSQSKSVAAAVESIRPTSAGPRSDRLSAEARTVPANRLNR